MKRQLYICFLALTCTAAASLLSYAFMAALACFVAWTNEYWSVAAWGYPARFALFCVVCFWVVVGIQTALTYDKKSKEARSD